MLLKNMSALLPYATIGCKQREDGLWVPAAADRARTATPAKALNAWYFGLFGNAVASKKVE